MTTQTNKTTSHLELYNYSERIHPDFRKEHIVGNGWRIATRTVFENGTSQTLRRDYGLDEGGALLAVAFLSQG